MTARRYPWSVIDFERALDDPDYYADVHRTLKGGARARFELAVDALWRVRHPVTTTTERN